MADLWRTASAQILRALRGRRSQAAWSRRLGYQSNVACEWEAGRRVPTAAEALRACLRARHDVERAFEAFDRSCADALWVEGELAVDRWLSALLGDGTVNELAARSGFSRYAISRWLRGQAQPRLHDFLALVEAMTGRAADLVERLVDINQVPVLQAVQARRAAAKRIAFELPWSEAVMRVLETEEFHEAEHSSGKIAGRLGLDVEDEDTLIAALVEAGLVRLEQGRYRDLKPLSVDTAGTPADFVRLRAHWSRVAAERSASPRERDFQGYNLLSASHEDIERIREVLQRAFREIRAIVAASEPAQAVALVNLHMLTWEAIGD